jgi:hypothetical protein
MFVGVNQNSITQNLFVGKEDKVIIQLFQCVIILCENLCLNGKWTFDVFEGMAVGPDPCHFVCTSSRNPNDFKLPMDIINDDSVMTMCVCVCVFVYE